MSPTAAFPHPCAVFATLSLLSVSAVAQDTRRELAVVRPPTPYRIDPQLAHADRVVVKFREGIRVRLADGELHCLERRELSAVARAVGDATVERLFTRPVDELDRERVELSRAVAPGEAPLADLNNYFVVTTSGAATSERLVEELLALGLIETAYAEPIPIPLDDIPPPTPNFESLQGHLDGAPGGYGYRAVERIVGARLPDDRMAQLEGGWTLNHEDCSWLDSANYVGLPPSGRYLRAPWPEHGTACVGLMAAHRNSYGVRGFGSDCAQFYLCSLTNGGANMVSLMTAVMGAGDVMSSSFAYGIAFNNQTMHAPRDFPQADFDAIQRAAAKGIHYTFGAGNTGQNLENQAIYGTRYLRTSPSSGGYIIGATSPRATSRVSWSNYGHTHVIANGWGSGVATIGYGRIFDPGGDVRQRYTNDFGGTSAAGPQVAGVVATYVGIVKEQTGVVLTVDAVKQELRATGTPVAGDVGTRPDLGQLLARAGLPDGLDVNNDTPPGGSFTYDVVGRPGEPFGVAISGARGRTDIGANRPLLLDANTLFVLAGGTLPGSGRATLSVDVPGIPALQDADFYLQAGLIRSGALHLTNSATVWLQ